MRGASRWRFAVLPVVMAAIFAGNFSRNRDTLTQAWPLLREMIGTSVLVVVCTATVALVVTGFVFWRRERLR